MVRERPRITQHHSTTKYNGVCGVWYGNTSMGGIIHGAPERKGPIFPK